MLKVVCASVIVLAVSIQVAEAGRRGRCRCYYVPAAPAQAAPAEKQPAAPATDQAQRPQATRSFSYEPAAGANYAAPSRFYAGTLRQDPRIIGSYGRRPASDKTMGRY